MNVPTVVCMMLCRIIRMWGRWQLMQWLCGSLYRQYKGDFNAIPRDRACPLKVFKACNTSDNLFRFIPFAIWLKNQPRSFYWFRKIQKDFPRSVPSISSLVRMKIGRYHGEKEDDCYFG